MAATRFMSSLRRFNAGVAGGRIAADAGRERALGARAAFGARAFAAALAVEGGEGVANVLELLRAELRLALALLGCTSPDQVSRSHVEPTVPYDPVA